MIGSIVNGINEFIEKARQLGKNVDNCTNNYQTKIENIQRQLDKNATECIDEKLKKTKETVNQGLTIELKEIPNIVEHLAQEVKNCGTNPICIRMLGIPIGIAAMILPAMITDVVNETNNATAKYLVEMLSCVHERFENADNEIKAVENEVTSCIKKLINNN